MTKTMSQISIIAKIQDHAKRTVEAKNENANTTPEHRTWNLKENEEPAPNTESRDSHTRTKKELAAMALGVDPQRVSDQTEGETEKSNTPRRRMSEKLGIDLDKPTSQSPAPNTIKNAFGLR